MTRLAYAAVLALATAGIAGCSDNENADENAAAAAGSAGMETQSAAASGFPKGSRIVEEDGVTFRVDTDGTRIRLGPADSRIVVENDVRYRVDPDGSRIRIGPDGAEFEVDADELDARVRTGTVPLEVETN